MKPKILFVTTFYPPNNKGSAVLMENLINGLDKSLIAGVITQADYLRDVDLVRNDISIYKINHLINLFPNRFKPYLIRLTLQFAFKKVKRIIKEKKISHILGAYPHIDFLEFARSIAKKEDLKFISYLHDTIVEGIGNKRNKCFVENVQRKVFSESQDIFVMSQGMKNLYKKKYDLNTIPLLHSFFETLQEKEYRSASGNSIFMGGHIYGINKETVKRISIVAKRIDLSFGLSSANNKEVLQKQGFETENIHILPFLSRPKFLKFLREQKALLLSIDWPDESTVHVDELSTIFPTKTIEYLISGIPIIVHCSKDYFLAKFFKAHECALLITERNLDVMEEQIKSFLEDEERLKLTVSNAYKASKQFHISQVKKVFESIVNKST